MTRSITAPVGVVLAGGAGSRMGAPKATALLAGRPLIAYPLDALRAVTERVVVVAKSDTELPDDLGAERWEEPDEPRHPLTGITYALERAAAPILVVAADMPLVTADALSSLVEALASGGHAAVAVCGGQLEPLLGAYGPEAIGVLGSAADDTPLRRTVEQLDPVLVKVAEETVFNVNTPEDLAEAELLLRS
jgi:molybdopterin-guanine dinucleotide biosynthesis protein A